MQIRRHITGAARRVQKRNWKHIQRICPGSSSHSLGWLAARPRPSPRKAQEYRGRRHLRVDNLTLVKAGRQKRAYTAGISFSARGRMVGIYGEHKVAGRTELLTIAYR